MVTFYKVTFSAILVSIEADSFQLLLVVVLGYVEAVLVSGFIKVILVHVIVQLQAEIVPASRKMSSIIITVLPAIMNTSAMAKRLTRSEQPGLTLTIASVAIVVLLRVLLADVNIESLSQVAIEFAEAVLVGLVEEHFLNEFVIVQAFVELIEQVTLNVSSIGLLCRCPIAFIKVNDQHGISLRFLRSQHFE